MLDVNNETEIVHMLQYHVLQEKIFTKDFTLSIPQFLPTTLINQSFTNITQGQRITVLRSDEDEITITSGLDSRSMILSDMQDIHFFDGNIQAIDTLLVTPLSLAGTVFTRFPAMSAFLGALYKTGIADQILLAQNMTIFAPQNEAFQKTISALKGLSDTHLRNVLWYHIVPNAVLYSGDLRHDKMLDTAAIADDTGKPLTLSMSILGNNRYIDSSQILDPDVLIANGVVHMCVSILPMPHPCPLREIIRMTDSYAPLKQHLRRLEPHEA